MPIRNKYVNNVWLCCQSVYLHTKWACGQCSAKSWLCTIRYSPLNPLNWTKTSLIGPLYTVNTQWQTPGISSGPSIEKQIPAKAINLAASGCLNWLKISWFHRKGPIFVIVDRKRRRHTKGQYSIAHVRSAIIVLTVCIMLVRLRSINRRSFPDRSQGGGWRTSRECKELIAAGLVPLPLGRGGANPVE